MKHKIILFVSLFSITCFSVVTSCKKKLNLTNDISLSEPVLPATSYDYRTKTGVNNDVATLGRVLFYDKKLSVNNSTSCGSCHKQSLAFSDNTAFSKGFDGRKTRRNTLPIENISAFIVTLSGIPTLTNQNNVSLFWDGRANNLAKMTLMPVANHIEMHMTDFNQLCTKLNATNYYPNLFEKAFGNKNVSSENIALALAGFIQTLQSRNSKFDKSIPQFMNSQNPPVMVPLNALEQQGLTAFTSTYNCNTCHNISPNGYNGTNEGFANIGLDANYTDNGVGEQTNKTADNGSFKIPNLRNVALTSPYMHDGRFNTLDEVLEHYSHNIQPNPNVSLLLKDFTILNKMFEKDDTTGAYLLPVQQKNISSADKKAIIAFLNTLTDYDFISNPMYSNPFIKK
ncbi:MAG: hypothetical protein RIQ33_1160 [Bacteroidota bacterium]|jgi:cytochrome c peroxidase